MTVQEETGGGLTILTVSEIGADHLARRMPNQDAADFRRMGEDFVLVVSDGVGSCSRAELGARYAVRACVRLWEGLREGTVPFGDAAMVRTLLADWRACVPEGEADEYCATLKAVFKLESGAKIVSVGDGFAIVASGGRYLLSPTDETCFFNETKCLGARTEETDFWTAEFPLEPERPYVCLCCTDGVANGLLPGTEARMTEEIERAVPAAELAAELEKLLKDISTYCTDDKTVGVAKYEGGYGGSDRCDGAVGGRTAVPAD